jgi:hypothetical protein
MHATWNRVARGRGRVGALVAVCVALGLFLAAELPGLATASPPSLTVVQKPGVAPSNSASTGAVPAATSITGVIGLDPNNPAALSAYAQAVVTPSSPMYHHYLAAGQFRTRFGPSAATISAVTSDLKQSGVTVTSVSQNGLLIKYSTTAAQAQSAFHTHLGQLRLASGRTAITPTSSVQLPSSIAGDVQTVTGLNTVIQPQDTPPVTGAAGHPAAAAPAATTAGDGPSSCSAATTDAQTYGGLTDPQIASAYGVSGLYSAGEDGAGQTIDVYELEPFSTADLKTFDTCYFGASKATTMLHDVSITKVDGGVQSGEGSGESILDMDDVSALAPGAKIDVFEAPDTDYGLIDNFNAIVQDDNAKVATSSWFSGCESQIETELPGLEKEENSIFEQAAVQGQTVLEASGDDGSDACAIHGTSPVSPVISEGVEESQPYVMSVGGTTITDATDPPSETVWNDGAVFGAGSGGISSVWAAPSWQADSGVPGVDNSAVVKHAEAVSGNDFCGAGACRETPDVSAQADEFTGAVTVYAAEFGGWITIGGTSSATPLWAAMLADIDSTPACVASGGIGFVPPKLYAIAADSTEYAASFNDVTSGNNDVFDDAGGLFPATVGYDMATGLGSPQVTGPGDTRGLAYYLCASTDPTIPAVQSVSPQALPQAGGTVTITGSDFRTGATSSVSGVQVGTFDLPQADYSVTGPGTIVAHLPSSTTLAGSGTPSSSEGAGTYDISVTLFDGQSSVPTAGSRLTYDAAATAVPQVDGVSPSGGANEAGGRTFTVYGSGFSAGTGMPKVTIGGIPATGVKVLSDSELTAVTPAYSSGTACATDLNPTTDICQAELQVTTSLGSSAESKIKPEFSGDLADAGGSQTEEAPAATEFDYLPTPTITGVTIQGGGLASEQGGTVAVITGTGLGYLGIDWVNVGPYQQNASQDDSLVYDSATEIQVMLPPESPTTSPLTEPITVQTEGSLNNTDIVASAPSNAGSVTYAPVPQVSGISVPGSSYTAGPTTGGTDLVIDGVGLGDATSVQFTDVGPGEGGVLNASGTTALTLSSVTPTSVALQTPADNAGTDQVSVCDASGCSAPVAENDIFTYYAPGNPVVSSVHPAKGAAGTTVTIDGQNLGYVTGVFFGGVKAKTFANVPALLDSGSTSQITATVPAGTAGAKVNVRVTTLESQATGSGKSAVTPSATFTYTG